MEVGGVGRGGAGARGHDGAGGGDVEGGARIEKVTEGGGGLHHASHVGDLRLSLQNARAQVR